MDWFWNLLGLFAAPGLLLAFGPWMLLFGGIFVFFYVTDWLFKLFS